MILIHAVTFQIIKRHFYWKKKYLSYFVHVIVECFRDSINGADYGCGVMKIVIKMYTHVSCVKILQFLNSFIEHVKISRVSNLLQSNEMGKLSLKRIQKHLFN